MEVSRKKDEGQAGGVRSSRSLRPHSWRSPKGLSVPFSPTSASPPQRPQQHGLCTSGTPLLASLRDTALSPRAPNKRLFPLQWTHTEVICGRLLSGCFSGQSPVCVQVLLGVFFTSGKEPVGSRGRETDARSGERVRCWLQLTSPSLLGSEGGQGLWVMWHRSFLWHGSFGSVPGQGWT